MVVKLFMTHNPFTIRPDTTVTDAQALMRREKIHRLPVLDRENRLVGIISEKDVLYASPSPASTLSVYEMSALLSKLHVDKVMTKDVTTVAEDAPIEDAARIMADHDIGGLPVMRGTTLVGIITESDIFKLFIDLFGVRRRGIRVSIVVPETKGELAAMTSALSAAGANIISLGTFSGEDMNTGLCTLKVEDISKDALLETLKPFVKEFIDVREV